MRQPTPRQLEILALLSVGHTNGEVAEQLVLAEKTVKTHVQTAMRRLHVRTRTHAVALCIRQGWL